jgi:hypothetical protein
MKSIIVHTHSCLCQHIPTEYWYRNLKSGLWLHTQYTRVSFLRIRAHSTVHVSKQTKIIYLNKHDKVRRAIVCKAQKMHRFKLCKPLLRPYQGHKASDKRNERIRCNSSAFTLSGTIALPFGVIVRTRSSTVILARPFFLVKALHWALSSSLQPHSMSRSRNNSFNLSFSPLSIN